MKNKDQGLAGLIVIGISLVIFGLACGGGNSSSTPTKMVDGKEVKVVIGAPDQVKFHAEVATYGSSYFDAGNEMKKSKVYRDLRAFLTGYLKSGAIRNWEGRITDIGTTEGGSKAYVKIEANFEGKQIVYKTWNNQLSDFSTHSMLSLNSPVYKQVENLAEGDNVVFSGSFLRDSKKGFSESSLSEQGTVTDPEYIIRFTSITKKEEK